jgi:hypothetical protein
MECHPTKWTIPMNYRCRLASALPLLVTLLAGCAEPGAVPVAWDRKAAPPTITPLKVDGLCTLLVSGTAKGDGSAIGRVTLDVYEGIAQIDVVLASPDSHSSSTFHVVVPLDEQHVDVIYIGQPRYPIWERAAGGRTCAS